MRITALLGALHGEHAVLLGRSHHRPALGHGVRQRLLDVDGLAGLGRLNEWQAVPVLCGGDQHGIDVATLQDTLVFHESLGFRGASGGPERFGRLFHPRLEYVRNHRDFDIGPVLHHAQ